MQRLRHVLPRRFDEGVLDAVAVFISDAAGVVCVNHGCILYCILEHGDMTAQERSNIFTDDDEDLVSICYGYVTGYPWLLDPFQE